MEESKTTIEIPLYKVCNNLNENYNIFTINASHLIDEIYNSKDTEINIHKIILPENSKAIELTNIIYFENDNKTLPQGMDMGDKVLVNLSDYNLTIKNKETNHIVFKEKEKIQTKKINIFEYIV